MKLQIHDRPGLAAALISAAALLLWLLVDAAGRAGWIALPFALFYSLLAALCLWAWRRTLALEQPALWSTPERLLILAPHEDDCVIAAGGIGALNLRLGGATRVLHLATDEAPGMAEVRSREARAAWRLAGLDAADVRALDLLPKLRQRDPQRLRAAAAALRTEIDAFRPTVIVAPMFEGGHVHHDMTVGLLDQIVTDADDFRIYEAPEYTPLASLSWTPHRVLTLCLRWLGLVSYYGPPDGIDARKVLVFRLGAEDLALKKRMLACFASQNAPSLVATRGYPDRLVTWERTPDRRTAFDLKGSYLGFVLAARRVLPASIVDRLFPVQRGTMGREGRLADWQEEWRL